MENKKQSRAEAKAKAKEEEEIETFLKLIGRLGEIRRKNGELSAVRDAGDRDPVGCKKKKIKWTVKDRLDRDQDVTKRSSSGSSSSSSSSNWVPSFKLEDFGEVVGSRRSASPELQEQVTINSKELVLIEGEDNDDDDCGLNLKLTL